MARQEQCVNSFALQIYTLEVTKVVVHNVSSPRSVNAVMHTECSYTDVLLVRARHLMRGVSWSLQERVLAVLSKALIHVETIRFPRQSPTTQTLRMNSSHDKVWC